MKLKELEESSIVSFEYEPITNKVEIIECCDYYHRTTFIKSEMIELIAELQNITDMMD